jgi:hypothetical protein
MTNTQTPTAGAPSRAEKRRKAVTVNGAEQVAGDTPASTGLIDLSCIGAKPKSNGRTVYPVHPDPTSEVATLVPMIRREADEFATLEGNFKIHKAELTALAVPFYFETNRNRIDIPSSVACHGADGAEVLVTFESRFLKTTEARPIIAAMGAERYARFVRQSYVIKIDGDLIPAQSAPALIGELVELFAKHGATAALSKDEVLTGTPEFMAHRFSAFTPEENLAVQMALPIRTAVKTKGRK